MLTKLTRNNERGFSLIELMIVIAIIGALAAIAIPQFSSFRKRSFNAAAKADTRNLATSIEAYYMDTKTYSNSVSALTGSTYAFVQSEYVTVGVSGDANDYTITAFHRNGDKTYSLSGSSGTITEIQ